jgi:excisionase family DNA binding protein
MSPDDTIDLAKNTARGDPRPQPAPPRAFSITEFCRRYGIGRTNVYEQIAAGRLRAVKAGRRTLITLEAAEAWLAALPELQVTNDGNGGPRV